VTGLHTTGLWPEISACRASYQTNTGSQVGKGSGVLAEEQGMLCATGHAGYTGLFELLDVSRGCLVLESASAKLATVVGAPSTHCSVCHSYCVMASSCHTPNMLQMPWTACQPGKEFCTGRISSQPASIICCAGCDYAVASIAGHLQRCYLLQTAYAQKYAAKDGAIPNATHMCICIYVCQQGRT